MTRWVFVNERALLVCVITLFVCRAAFVSTIVPPWQGPDEPNHFALSKLLTMPIGAWQQNTVNSTQVEQVNVAQVEREVLRSMARHRWWEHRYSLPTPDPLPTSFAAVGQGQNLGVGTYAQPLYYGIGAAVLRITRPQDLDASYWHLRMLSVVFGIATLALGWAGTRLLFDPVVAIGSTAVTALHPQFLLTALTVNPDALIILCGAFIWWQVARISRQQKSAFSVALVLVVGGAALLTKRSALPIVAAGVLVSLVFVLMQTRVINRRQMQLAAVAAIVVAGVLFLVVQFTSLDDSLTGLMTFWSTALTNRRPLEETALGTFLRIVPTSVDNFWLVASWSRFPAPEPWFWIVRMLTVAGVAGAVGLLVQSSGRRRELCVAWLFVMLQVTAVYVASYQNYIVPHGRLLFPVIAPAAVIFWTGVMWAVPTSIRRHAAPLLVTVVAALDLTVLTLRLVPVYVH